MFSVAHLNGKLNESGPVNTVANVIAFSILHIVNRVRSAHLSPGLPMSFTRVTRVGL